MSLYFSNISLIVAYAHNNIIGCGQKLPWNLPEDLKFFKEKTINNSVIMGYNTYKSIGKPLPDRVNIVLSSKKRKFPNNIIQANNLQQAVFIAEDRSPNKEIFIIGGESIYNQSINFAKTLYITEIDLKVKGNKFFPKIDSKSFKEINRIKNKTSVLFDFVTYKRF